MFFRRSKLIYSPVKNRPNILALSSDAELSEIRIRPFLSSLLARDVIAGFGFADRKMNPVGWFKSLRFSHIWCHRNISSAQYRFLKKHTHVPIIYDLDDLLTDVPDFVMKRRSRTVDRINWCLGHAKVVTTATTLLGQHLRDHVPARVDIIVLKNGCADYLPPRCPALKKRMIWTSGDLPFVLKDHPHFMKDVAKLVNNRGYEMIFIGRFDQEYVKLFERCRHIQRLDYASYLEFLRFNAGAIAFAPLPSGLPAPVQRYFDAKSDIKLVDYLSAGLVPVCSSTAPYSNSDLFIPRLAAPDRGGLLEKLDMCIEKHSSMIEYVAEMHIKERLKQRDFLELSKALDSSFQG